MILGTLYEELRRRLRNMNRWHSEEEKMDIFKKVLVKMVDSGYDSNTRSEVVR